MRILIQLSGLFFSSFWLAWILFFPAQNSACTAFSMVRQDSIVVGKNLDWPIGDGILFINQSHVDKYALVYNGKPATWRSRYGSITFNQFGKEFPLGGMNEAGLVVEELSYSPSRYGRSDSLPTVNEFQWVQYQLDNYASVNEVLDNLSGIQIEKLLFGLHYFICDRSGHSAAIEFLDGNTAVYTKDQLPFSVLSNNSYENALKYLKVHKGFGGDRDIVRGRDASQERFLRAADMITYPDTTSPTSMESYAFDILSEVSQEDTQWRIVYDPADRVIRFKIRDCAGTPSIRFSDLDFSAPRMFIMKSDCRSYAEEITFGPYAQADNNRLLAAVLQQLCDLSEVEVSFARKIITDIGRYLSDLPNYTPGEEMH